MVDEVAKDASSAAAVTDAPAPAEDTSMAAVAGGEGAGESAAEGSKKRGRAADFL